MLDTGFDFFVGGGRGMDVCFFGVAFQIYSVCFWEKTCDFEARKPHVLSSFER